MNNEVVDTEASRTRIETGNNNIGMNSFQRDFKSEDSLSVLQSNTISRPATSRDPECLSSADYAWLMQRRKEKIAKLDPNRDDDLDRKLLEYQKVIEDMIAGLNWILEQEEEFVDGYCGHEDCDRYEQAECNKMNLQDVLVDLENVRFLLEQSSS